MKLFIYFILLIGLVYGEKAEITAKRFYADQKEHLAVFGGDVHLRKTHDELNASKVVIEFDKSNKPLRYKADGDVRFHVQTDASSIYEGRCDSMVYTPSKKEYHFMKNVHITEIISNRKLEGEKIIVNARLGTANVEGDEKKPLRITLDVDFGSNNERKGLNVSDANLTETNNTQKTR